MTSKSEQKRINKMNKTFGINQIVKEQINPLKEPWYFETFKDKLILIIILILAVWKAINLLWLLF